MLRAIWETRFLFIFGTHKLATERPQPKQSKAKTDDFKKKN